MFSIQKKDGLGRIGTILTSHGKISTPVLLPVINPNRQEIPPTDMVKCGAEAFITNAYLLYRDTPNREEALKQGLHKFIGFDGPLMTDSGAFQLMEYGEVSITNSLITSFQEQIQSDIGVFLDIPTKQVDLPGVQDALKRTLIRADEHIQHRDPSSKTLWAGPIQGGEYLNLVEQSSMEMARKAFDIHPIGSVVPYLEKYNYETVINMILTAKKILPLNRPIHLFGAGHPMFFAISVFLGIDMFDSAAYFLYARKNRYLTEFGTQYLDDLQYFPCSCDICLAHSVKELQRLDHNTRTQLLAKHNLNVSFEEIRRIKQAIIEGRLYELVLSRTMTHPSLARLIPLLFETSTSKFIEAFTPISSKRATLFSHPVLKSHPQILRYKERIFDRFYPWNSKLVLARDFRKIRSTDDFQVLKISPLFGVIPDELQGVYPLVQHERIPMIFTEKDIAFIERFVNNYRDKFESIELHSNLEIKSEILDEFKVMDKNKKGSRSSDKFKLHAILDYQFGSGTHRIFDNMPVTIHRSPKTGILRNFTFQDNILGTLRPTDFSIIPSKSFAKELCDFIPSPRLRVVASNDTIPFVSKNKDLLAKFVENVDPDVKCGEEVFIVDGANNFINSGSAHLSAAEMIQFNHGIAVRVRR
ncbi:MAG: tRNA guanosine(15) transglycosylase TgtA [Candidatus Hodarchaeales archaeon]|jgi:7-cyano-7-deazaguanine tRNA-ribosyltransferase